MYVPLSILSDDLDVHVAREHRDPIVGPPFLSKPTHLLQVFRLGALPGNPNDDLITRLKSEDAHLLEL